MFDQLPSIVAIPAVILGGAGIGILALELLVVPFVERKRAQVHPAPRVYPLEAAKAWLFIRDDRL